LFSLYPFIKFLCLYVYHIAWVHRKVAVIDNNEIVAGSVAHHVGVVEETVFTKKVRNLCKFSLRQPHRCRQSGVDPSKGVVKNWVHLVSNENVGLGFGSLEKVPHGVGNLKRPSNRFLSKPVRFMI
jgi:hypothetical protein